MKRKSAVGVRHNNIKRVQFGLRAKGAGVGVKCETRGLRTLQNPNFCDCGNCTFVNNVCACFCGLSFNVKIHAKCPKCGKRVWEFDSVLDVIPSFVCTIMGCGGKVERGTCKKCGAKYKI